ncbi:MAG: HAD hydrolase-like protein [Pseudomonadota bacterium]
MPAPHDLLFDLDGTLSDPLVGIGRSINYALTHYGYPAQEIGQMSVHIGPPLDDTFKTLTGVTTPSHIQELVAKYRERYADVGYSENVLYPGIPEALAAFGTAGIHMGVCTSKRVDFAEQILEMFGLRTHFRFVSGGEIGIHKWQQIQGLVANGQVGVSSVMVGDRALDMVAAHRNGLQAAGVLWGHGSREELAHEQPRYLFASVAELLTLGGLS